MKFLEVYKAVYTQHNALEATTVQSDHYIEVIISYYRNIILNPLQNFAVVLNSNLINYRYSIWNT